MKGQFMTLSAVVVSLITLSTISVITEVQNQEYSPSDQNYHVNMIQEEIEEANLSKKGDRARLEQNINEIGGYQMSADYWQQKNCYNVSMIRSDTEIRLNCLK